MKFITRANSSPQGKQKIYFTGHPDDCKTYFPDISNQILKLCDCAVFYDEDPEHPEDIENFTEDLNGMQLIVLLVTGNYIFGDTFAHNTVFAHAIERHIPVLPILMNSELANDFSKKCGDLHCLMPNSTDVTEISYEEKLKSFLESVLVGDELAEKVRAAFDAYIFLSYRKKDRRYAQELMKLIHSNEFCRDIAIWYDEFLTPGENFNEAIRAAMEKSELFALAVTPNLLEEPNYVMTEEYPAALDLGKKILPAELLETNKNELDKRYENIPEPIDPTNSTVMSERLAGLLENIAKRENDSDPRHNFLIGLAYLNGIDVEVDQKRAVELITGAAEAELPEALEKLASMYWTGNSVTRDRAKAIEYQQRLTEVLERVYKAEQEGDIEPAEDHPEEEGGIIYVKMSKTEKNAYALAKAEDQLGEYLREFGDLSGAESLYKKAYELSGGFPKKWAARIWNLDHFTNILSGLGEVYMAKGDFSNAIFYFEQSVEMEESLDTDPDSPEDLILAYYKLGGLCVIMGDLSAASIYYNKSIKRLERNTEKRESLTEQRLSATAFIGLGEISKRLGHYSKSKDDYEKAIDIYNHIISQPYSTDSDFFRLAGIYMGFADLLRSMSDLRGSTDYCMKSLDIFEQLDRKQGSVDPKKEIADCHILIGENNCLSREYLNARKHFDLSLSLYKKISIRDSSADVLRGVSTSYIGLGDVYEALGDSQRAYNCYCDGFSTATRLAEKTNLLWPHEKRAYAGRKLGRICASNGDLDTARKFFEMCVEANEIISKNTDLALPREELAESYVRLGDIHLTSGDTQNAMSCFIKGVEILESLQDTDIRDVLSSLSVTFGKIGNIYMQSNDLRRASEYYLKGIDAAKKLIGKSDIPLSHELLANQLISLGNTSYGLNDNSKAREYFEEAAAEFSTDGIADSPYILNNLNVCYNKLCFMDIGNKNYSSAGDYCDKEIKAIRGLVNHYQSTEMYLRLAEAYDRRASLYFWEKNQEKAADFTDNALNIYRFLAKNVKTTEIYLKLAEAYDKRASMYFFERNDEKATELIDNALYIYRLLAKTVKTAETKFNLAKYYEKLGGFFESAENSSAAIEYYGQSSDTYSELLEQEVSERVCAGLGRVSVTLADLLAPNKLMYDSLHLAENAFKILVRLCPDNAEYSQALIDVQERLK